MNKFVFGFNQEMVMKLGIGLKDLLLLKYINDAIEGKKFLKKEIDGMDFYWIKMSGFMEGYPILNIAHNVSIRRKLKVLVEKGLLEHKVVKGSGTFAFYRKTEFFNEIYSDIFRRQDTPNKNVSMKGIKMFDGHDENVWTNNNNKYNKKHNKKIYKKDLIESVIDYLNLKAGCSYGYENKTSNKYIADIFKDEYTLDDVKAVIDKKVSEWKGTDYEKYLRPYTLFKPDNFEQYVNSIDTKVLETSFKDEYVLEDYDVNW